MCGDGANDLLALRQADLSFGFQTCDASYGSSFAIQKIEDVDLVIKESKNTVSNLMQMFIYMVSTFVVAELNTVVFAVSGSEQSP